MAKEGQREEYADISPVSDDAGFATVHGTPLDDATILEMFPGASKEQVAMLKWSSGLYRPGELILRQDLPISTFRLFAIADGEVECVLLASDRKTVVRVLDRATATKHDGQYFLIPDEIEIAPYALRAVSETKLLRINGKLVEQLLTVTQARNNAMAHSRKIIRGLSEEYGLVRNKSGYGLVPYLLQLIMVVEKNPDLEKAIMDKMETFCEWAVKYDPSLPHKQRVDNEESLRMAQRVLAKLGKNLSRRRK